MTVVVDYRNDAKSSTGNFEMIYRQVIPAAPAYLGLNLFLKGTQVLPKNFAGKKEKPKIDVGKLKNERKNLSIQSTREPENEKLNAAIALSPRAFVVDFVEGTENKNLADSPMSSRKNTQLKAITSIRRSNADQVPKEVKSPRSRLNLQAVINREHSKIMDALKDNQLNGVRKVLIKTERRHASCGPRLMSTNAPADDSKNDDIEIVVSVNDSNEIRCIGNKYGPDSEITATTDSKDTNNNPTAIDSPRKQSLETPRTALNFRTRLKPINTLTKPNAPKASVSNANISKEKSVKTNVTSSTAREYRKYLTQSNIQLNKLPSKLPIHDNYYNSHFFAVGLSLRAWRSKYSRILSNGTNNNAANSVNSSLKQRKTKKNDLKTKNE